MHLVEITKTNLAAAVAELAEKQVVKLGKQASARERAGLQRKLCHLVADQLKLIWR
jgi:hypothetical protein